MRGGKIDNNSMVFLELPFAMIPALRTPHFDSHVVMKATCVRMGFPTAYQIAIVNLRETLIKTMCHSIGKYSLFGNFFVSTLLYVRKKLLCVVARGIFTL